jgi:GNAT superfamily N-acetyltransferase
VTSDDVQIRPAVPGDGERLLAVAAAAKGHWGYDPDRVARWIGELVVLGDEQREVHVACVDGRPVAWMGIVVTPPLCLLDDLWVEPAWMGRGIGSRLFRLAIERGRARGAATVELEAERNSVGFYTKVGARHLRNGEPSDWGTPNPIMMVDLRA